MRPVVYGKHPAFGDFLTHGLSAPGGQALEAWLDACLPEVRTAFGADWEAGWTAAAPLQFWLPEAVLTPPVAGLFLPSMDRVGRKYPFVIGWAEIPAPPEPDAAMFTALWQHLGALDLTQDNAQGVASLVDGLEPPEPGPEPEQAPEQSHWRPVQPQVSGAGWVTVDGLPDANTLGWLLTAHFKKQDY